MRHGKKFNHLTRKTAHRKALLKNLSISLILNKRITTTVAKAKALRKFFEPLLTRCKQNTQHAHRVLFSYLQNEPALNELFKDIRLKIEQRNGGYTRIIRTGYRKGDNASLCMMELVDYNDLYQNGKETKKKRRTRRGKGLKTTENQEEQTLQTPLDTQKKETPEKK